MEVGAGARSYPQTAKDHFRRVYYEAIDLIVSAIYQESFSSYAQMETLLVKAGNGDHYEAEFKFLEVSYSLYRGATLACNWVFSGAPNENIVQNHLNIALLNALIFSI